MPKTSRFFHLLLCVVLCTACPSKDTPKIYGSETLKIIRISENSFIHISYLQSPSFGKVACNGLIYINAGEAVVFDTPSDRKTTRELIAWIEKSKGQIIKALVVNHFHIDALGGIVEFSLKGIPSYSNNKTANLISSKKKGPTHVFEKKMDLTVGQTIISNRYFGPAHTLDNIVSYIPEEELLFGGCMIKSLDASKGNLEDADTKAWSNTVTKIKNHYPNLKIVVPGHGAYGTIALLDYTISLFKINNEP